VVAASLAVPGPVVVVGSGGFAAELVHYLRACQAVTPGLELAGIVDDHLAGAAPAALCGLPFLGGVNDAAQLPGCSFVVATGTPRFRRETIEALQAAGRALYTLVHPLALVAPDAVVGDGSIVAPYAIVNARARLGPGSVVNVFCSVGHDSEVGAYSVLSPYAALNGWSSVGEQCFLGTRATIFPRVHVGRQCQVDSHAYVKADTGDRMIISVRGDYRVLHNRLEN
jgi:sugar O-acyltransferase (sialic acid O-acetyltransferase NeuD family)